MSMVNQNYPKRITVHCTASPNGVSRSVEEIADWHKARGFKSIGYHQIIDIDGISRVGRPLAEVGAHVEDANTGNVGICLVGNDKFTLSQFHGLREEIRFLCNAYRIPHWEIWTHSQWPSAIRQKKSCPNMPIQRILAWVFDGEEEAIKPYLFLD